MTSNALTCVLYCMAQWQISRHYGKFQDVQFFKFSNPISYRDRHKVFWNVFFHNNNTCWFFISYLFVVDCLPVTFSSGPLKRWTLQAHISNIQTVVSFLFLIWQHCWFQADERRSPSGRDGRTKETTPGPLPAKTGITPAGSPARWTWGRNAAALVYTAPRVEWREQLRTRGEYTEQSLHRSYNCCI